MTAVLGILPYSFPPSSTRREAGLGQWSRGTYSNGERAGQSVALSTPVSLSDPIRYITGGKKRRVEKLFAKSQDKCWQIPEDTWVVGTDLPRLGER